MKLKTKLFIQATKWTGFSDDEFKVAASTVKSESSVSFVVIDIDEVEIELDTPDFTQDQFTNGHVEQLRVIKEKLLAETHLKAKSIDEQIESLLAIENKV